MAKKFFILSVDGGGLKGLIAIKVMQVIERMWGQPLADRADMLAGTSTGGLIAATLSVPDKKGYARFDLQHLEQIYIEVGKSVFQQGSLELTGNETRRFQQILRQTLGDLKLSGSRRSLFVPAYNVTDNKIIIFKTRSALQNKLKDVLMVDVCRATSAVSPVFPTYELNYNGRTIECIDGGYYLKNPGLSALAEVWKHAHYYCGRKLSEKDIVLLSISTGSYGNRKKDWTTNFNDIMHEQYSDRNYIRQQKLDFDPERIRFMRVDLSLGLGGFSFMKLFEWMNRISALEENEAFKKDLLGVLP